MASILGRRQLFSRYIILIYKGEQNELDNLANVDIVFFNHAHLCERSQYNVRPLISYAQSRVFYAMQYPPTSKLERERKRQTHRRTGDR